MAEKLRQYETTFIMNADLEKEQRENIIENVKELITSRGGEIVDEDNWGEKRMAYEIDDNRSGHYVVLNFKIDPQKLDDLEYDYKLIENILRYLIVRADQ